MISYRQNAAVKLPYPEPVAVPVCGRCGGTGLIRWDSIYAPHGTGQIKGPCIRCRPADFCRQIGLGPRAVAAVNRHMGDAG